MRERERREEERWSDMSEQSLLGSPPPELIKDTLTHTLTLTQTECWLLSERKSINNLEQRERERVRGVFQEKKTLPTRRSKSSAFAPQGVLKSVAFFPQPVCKCVNLSSVLSLKKKKEKSHITRQLRRTMNFNTAVPRVDSKSHGAPTKLHTLQAQGVRGMVSVTKHWDKYTRSSSTIWDIHLFA